MQTTANSTVSQPMNDNVSQPKKPYHAPRFQEHGTVQELALSSGAGSNDDGSGPTYS